MKNLKLMYPDEFIRKILEGERDFCYVKLEQKELKGNPLQSLDSCDGFIEMNNYITDTAKNKIFENPFRVDYSSFNYLNAKGMKLISFRGKEFDMSNSMFFSSQIYNCEFELSKFKYCIFEDSRLESVIFRRSEMDYARFKESLIHSVSFENSDLRNVNFCDAKIEYCGFSYADIHSANFDEARLKSAYLVNVKNLENCLNMNTANILHAIVGEREKEFIDEIMQKKSKIVCELAKPTKFSTKRNPGIKNIKESKISYE